MPGPKKDFYRSLVFKLLSGMTLGRLRIQLPDGGEWVLGTADERDEVRVRVHRDVFFKKCVLYGDVGFGEAFVDGDWDSDDVAGVIAWMILNVENHPTLMDNKSKNAPVNFLGFINHLRHKLNANTVQKSRKNIAAHYDLGNDFFELFLDPGMTYSSAYFSRPDEELEAAQEAKYARLCGKLKLKSSDHVLEIGGGWGGWAVHAARHHHCRVKSITLSKEQHAYAVERVHKAGLSGKVDVEILDYRHVKGQFDKIVSIEMIEAVGHENLSAYFGLCHRVLKKDGLLALQMILAPDHRYDDFRRRPDWIQKHIFPGGFLPSFEAILKAIRKTGDLGLHDYEDMTPSYARTLSEWAQNFKQARGAVLGMGFDEAFVRKWHYYFSYCEAAFRMRNISVAQVVFSRPNNHAL